MARSMGAKAETTDTRKIKKAASVTWFRNFSVYVGERGDNPSRLEFFLSFCFKTKRKKREEVFLH